MINSYILFIARQRRRRRRTWTAGLNVRGYRTLKFYNLCALVLLLLQNISAKILQQPVLILKRRETRRSARFFVILKNQRLFLRKLCIFCVLLSGEIK